MRVHADEFYRIHGNHLGPAIATTDDALTITTGSHYYYPYGSFRYKDDSEVATPYRFTGQRQEADIGLYYYKARWYDPQLRRFIQPDTIVMSMGLNIYVHEIAPAEELTPTLSAGVSINHVTSVAMPLVAGLLMPIIKYNGLFIMTGGLIAMSLPFALAMRMRRPFVAHAAPVMAE